MTRVPIPKRKPRPPATQVGPVTAAIAAMRAADLDAADLTRIRALRRAIADRIEADIALLDALRGDPDIEQDAGEMPEGDDEREPESEDADAPEWSGRGLHLYAIGGVA